MANWRRMNYHLDTPPPGPVPTVPKITAVTVGDTTATVEWSYAANEVEVDHWDLYLYEGFALLTVLRIEGPQTRKHTLGELANGVTYGVELQGVNVNGHSPSSNRVDFTPKSLAIPAPTIVSITPYDGYIMYSYREGKPLPEGKITGHKYIAKRTDSGYEFEGDAFEDTSTVGHTGPVDNDRTYRLYLATVIDGKVGPYSEASEPVTPTNPVPPFPPVWAHIDADKWDRTATGGGKGVDWKLTIAQGAKLGRDDAGPMQITGYRYEIKEKTSGTVLIDRTIPSSQPAVSVSDTGPWMDGIAVMTCWAKNADGWSQPTAIEFDVEPHAELPIDFGVWQDVGEYRYHVAQESVTSYAKVNKRGIGMRFDYLVVGAGGAGHGVTTLGKQGGNGGSGEYKCGAFSPFSSGSITAKLGDGADYRSTTAGGSTNLNIIGSDIFSAAGGGTSTGKDNGTPSYLDGGLDIATLWPGAQELRIWYWNKPYSQFIGGAKVWDKSKAPDADLYGQGGGGTSSSASNHGGNGFGGLAVIRYKIADIPVTEPTLSKWGEWKHRRFMRKHARQVRRTRVQVDS